jgi:integrase/recombinase XerD
VARRHWSTAMLTQAVRDYVRLRHLGGFKYASQEILLQSFARFATTRGDSHIRSDTAIQWAAQAPSAEQSETRLRTIMALARHCRADDLGHEIPPAGVFGRGRNRRPVAYIYSPEEIRRLLTAALDLQPHASLRPHTYYALFGLLASTGLRIGEALRLRLHDITPEGLLILETKFKKSRLVPIHTTTIAALKEYLALRTRIGVRDDHVFVGLSGRSLSVASAQNAFREVVDVSGLATVRSGRSPRLHDLRHTWAVRALESSPREVGQIDRHMRAVLTYLGHVSVATGYWYLHATPVLMKRIADACAMREQGDAP